MKKLKLQLKETGPGEMDPICIMVFFKEFCDVCDSNDKFERVVSCLDSYLTKRLTSFSIKSSCHRRRFVQQICKMDGYPRMSKSSNSCWSRVQLTSLSFRQLGSWSPLNKLQKYLPRCTWRGYIPRHCGAETSIKRKVSRCCFSKNWMSQWAKICVAIWKYIQAHHWKNWFVMPTYRYGLPTEAQTRATHQIISR